MDSPYSRWESFDASWRELASRHGAEERIGESVEGRPIRAYSFGPAGAPAVMLTGLLHGVEVIGAIALREVARALVGGAGLSRGLADQLRFVFAPIVNPDAYAANAERVARGARAWVRGNARGVDLNRNFAPAGPARSASPFAGSRWAFLPHFAGPHPYSEPETRAVRDLALATRPKLALGFHSFGNLLLYPWGFTARRNPRAVEYERLGRAFRASQPGARYTLRQASGLYRTQGDLDDWLDAELGTLALTVEVGTLDRRLLTLSRLLDPFWWMNPLDVRPTVENTLHGVLGLLEAACSSARAVDHPTEPLEPRRGIALAARR